MQESELPTDCERVATPYQDILVRRASEQVLLIQIHRPNARNALRTPCLAEIAQALQDAEHDSGIRAVVITGDDKTFAAGADIGELAALDEAAARADRRPAIWRDIQSFSKPLIAVVRGYALGAGCELALLCDIVIAAENAQFGQPEVTLGIIPGAGGIQRLARVVGKGLAMKMVLSGVRLDAHAARDAGMATDVLPCAQALPYGLEFAESVARNAPLAVQAAKRVASRVYETSLEQGLLEERSAFCQLMDTEDKREGLAAFLEKRRPEFRGR